MYDFGFPYKPSTLNQNVLPPLASSEGKPFETLCFRAQPLENQTCARGTAQVAPTDLLVANRYVPLHATHHDNLLLAILRGVRLSGLVLRARSGRRASLGNAQPPDS